MRLSNLLSFFSMDRHVGYSLIFRVWSIFAGGILIVLIPFVFDSEEQGYYFTFASLIALQVFFELGLNYVIVQMVAHEMPSITYHRVIKGNSENVNRIKNLVQLLRRWYLIISILFFIIVFILGVVFFACNGKLSYDKWVFAWFFLVLFSSLNLFVSPFLSVLEGMGLVGDVARLRLYQSIGGYLLLFALLGLKFHLIAVVAISFVASLSSFFWLWKCHDFIFKDSTSNNVISWRKDIFPFQWKIALSWLSGYFIFQIFTPIIFAHQGAEEAGKIGITMTIFSTLLSLSISWVSAKNNVFGRLVSIGNRSQLNEIFWQTTIKSGVLNFIVVAIFALFVFFIQHYDIPIVNKISNRIAPLSVVVFLTISAVVNHLVFCFAAYMRAHKQEPMLVCSIVVALLTSISVYEASSYSSLYAVASYSLIGVLIALPWSYFLFRKFKIN